MAGVGVLRGLELRCDIGGLDGDRCKTWVLWNNSCDAKLRGRVDCWVDGSTGFVKEINIYVMIDVLCARSTNCPAQARLEFAVA